jgi:hypothetical protein
MVAENVKHSNPNEKTLKQNKEKRTHFKNEGKIIHSN